MYTELIQITKINNSREKQAKEMEKPILKKVNGQKMINSVTNKMQIKTYHFSRKIP